MSSTLESVGPQGTSQYVLGARIPAIGHEEVYLAERIAPAELRGPVVVKIARRTKPTFAMLRERFLDEALENASFVHPNLTAVADMVENEDGVFLVLENVDGPSLYEINVSLRRAEQAMSLELAGYIALEMLKGIHHLHTARGPSGERKTITIRDITPAHVLISTLGRVKIANRGLASALRSLERQAPAEMVAYYAPERIAGEPFSIRSDIYSLGVMYFELLTGRACFSGQTKEETLGSILQRGVPIAELPAAGVPNYLAAILERACAFVPERRYNSAVDMARDLEQWLFENAPKNLEKVMSRFLTLRDLARVAPSGLENDPTAVRFAGSPLGPEEERRREKTTALVRSTGIELTPSDIEALGNRPEMAAIFGQRRPSPEECVFMASVIRDGITEQEARAIATRPILPGARQAPPPPPPPPPPPQYAAPQAPYPHPPQARPFVQPVVQPVAPQVVLEEEEPELKRGSKAWWKETLLLVLIAVAMLIAAAAYVIFDDGVAY